MTKTATSVKELIILGVKNSIESQVSLGQYKRNNN